MAQSSGGTPSPLIRPKTSILDKSLSKGKQEVSLSAFALLFSETVQYCQVSVPSNFGPFPFFQFFSVELSQI